jgi:hypothetical protein
LEEIDTIETSAVDLSFLGHGYLASARDLLQDMYTLLLRDNLPPPERFGFDEQAAPGGLPYWSIGGIWSRKE